MNKLESSKIEESNSGSDQKAKYQKYAIIMIIIGVVMYFVIPFIAFLLVGGGIITLLTNIDRKSK